MALPKRKPKEGELESSFEARQAKEESIRLKERAVRALKEAQLLRAEGEEADAEKLEAEAADAQNQAKQKNTEFLEKRKKAERDATIAAAAGAIPSGIGQYVNSYAERFKSLTIQPLNRVQDVIASTVPFTGSFSRIKDRSLGGGFGEDGGGVFGGVFSKIVDRLDDSNIALNSISRSQVKIIKAEEETTHRVEKTEGATRDVEKAVFFLSKDIKALIGKSSDDMPSHDTSDDSQPELVARPIMSPSYSLSQPKNNTATAFMKTQTEALLKLVSQGDEQIELNGKILEELKEGDEDARLRSARARNDVDSGMRINNTTPTNNSQNENQGGGFMGWVGNIIRSIGAFFTKGFGMIARVIAPVVAGVAAIGAALAGIGRFFGLGGGATGAAAAGTGGAAALARGAVAAGAGGAAARGGAGVVARALGGSVGGFLARRLLPGAGFLQAGAQLADGNYLGAALSGLGGAASFIPGVGTLASIGLTTAGSMVNRETSQGVIRGVGNFFSGGRDRTPADARVDRLAQPTAARTPTPAPTVITTTHHHHHGRESDDRTVIAQSGKSIIERSRGDLFAYTA